MQKVKQYRWAPSLGQFEESPEKVWGVVPYDPDSLEPCVFCGVYGLADFYALWRYKGKRYVWWGGSDIRHLNDGYWLSNDNSIRLPPRPLARWININCENWVENEAEYKALHRLGIESNIAPSFLGDVGKFEVSFTQGNKVYSSVSGDDFELYKWNDIDALAKKHPEIEFHLYGNSVPWKTKNKNVIVHGRVPKEQFNEETSKMQGAIRLIPLDGFSEIIAKSVLVGQYPVSLISYPHTLSVSELGDIVKKKEPNYDGRNYYLRNLNKYPWSSN